MSQQKIGIFMTPNLQELFANLVERERVHGHHSPEGQAIRTLSRALDGWSAESLAGAEVVVMCGQAVEDWLKRCLNISPWSATPLNSLLAGAVAANLLQSSDAERLQSLLRYRAEPATHAFTRAEIEAVLQSSIEIIAQRWS
jgi:hypothetical protein